MSSVSNERADIIRTERGLTIAGTRITLYDVMDYVTAQYPPIAVSGRVRDTSTQEAIEINRLE